MTPLPALFVSHGSPMLALEPGPTGAFLAALGTTLDRSVGRPRAIVAISAHSTARAPVLLAAARHAAVHDFGGFPPALYALRYDAPGAPALAQDVMARLEASGYPAHRLDEGGLDHGIWSMLRFIYPEADVPVLPLAWAPSAPPAAQFALGAALAGLTHEGVLVLGTGSITHNLRRVFARGEADVAAPEVAESAAFRRWFAERSREADWPALFDYRRQAPHAVDMHPTDEHLLPWFVAAGAGGTGSAPRRIFESVTYGCLGMDAYAFGPGAGPLEAALSAPQSPGPG
ncbi:MAG: dioxygenase [Rhizobacter sp.]|jgi:4,5-DOPA dioxygenase extradiol